MASFKIKGGNKLSGEITPQGAKNEALQVICSCLLTKDKIVIDELKMYQSEKNLDKLYKFLTEEIQMSEKRVHNALKKFHNNFQEL